MQVNDWDRHLIYWFLFLPDILITRRKKNMLSVLGGWIYGIIRMKRVNRDLIRI